MSADAVVEQHVLLGRHLLRQNIPGADRQPLFHAPIGNLAGVARAARRQDDDVRFLGEDHVRTGFDAQTAIDADALRLHVEPADDAGHLFALRRLRREVDLAADRVAAFEQHDIVTARARHAGGFQACRTGADDDDAALGAGRGADDVRHRRLTRGGRVLDAQHVLAEVLAIDAVVGADALLDLVLAALANLEHHVRIGNLRARHAAHVDPAVGDDALGLRDVADALGVQDWHFRHLLDAGRQMHERLRRQRHGRHAVGDHVVGVGTGGDDADEIDQAGLRHRLRDVAQFVVAQAVVVEFIGAHADADAEVRTHGLAHGAQHLAAEAHAVFQAAAPFVVAHVGARRPELVDQLLVGGGNLDAVEAGVLDALCGLGEIADDAADILDLDDFGVAAVHQLAHAAGRDEMRPGIAGIG